MYVLFKESVLESTFSPFGNACLTLQILFVTLKVAWQYVHAVCLL